MINIGEVTFKPSPNLPSILRDAVETYLSKTAQQVETEAKRLVPVLTGNLRRSITHQVSSDAAIVSAAAGYAFYVEFGTGRMSPRPYLRPALASVLRKQGGLR